MDNKYEEEIEILDVFDDEEENTVEEPVKEEVQQEVKVEETPVYEPVNNYENIESPVENDSSDDDVLQGVDIPEFDPEENVDQPTEVEEPFFGYNFSQNNDVEPQVNDQPLVSENISINDQSTETPADDIFSFDFNNDYKTEQTDFSGDIAEAPAFEDDNVQLNAVEEPAVSEELNYPSQDTQESVIDDFNINDQFVESNESVESNIENNVENEVSETEDNVVSNADNNEMTTDNVEQEKEPEDNKEEPEKELKLKKKKSKKKNDPKTVLFVLLLILLIVAFAVLAPSLIESFM